MVFIRFGGDNASFKGLVKKKEFLLMMGDEYFWCQYLDASFFIVIDISWNNCGQTVFKSIKIRNSIFKVLVYFLFDSNKLLDDFMEGSVKSKIDIGNINL